MPDYSQGKIYTIRCRNDDTKIYVGSTTQQLSKRWWEHRYKDCIKYPNRLLYKTINNDWEKFYIELYENYACENREQLNRKEGEITRKIGSLNMNIAGRTMEEWRNENEIRIKEYSKEYRLKNIEKMKQSQKDNREKRRVYEREYGNKNAEKIKERRKEHYLKTFEKKQEYHKLRYLNAETVECDCGGRYKTVGGSSHFKTKLHQNYLQTLTEPITV